jgi:hypothetical protein
MKKLALLGLVVAAAGCSFHRHHETINKSVSGRTSMLARLAGTNPDAATITVTTETGDSRVFRVAQAVQGGLGDLRVGDPIIIAFDMSRGDTVVSIQPASLRPGLAASIVLPAPLPTTYSGVLFHGATPAEGAVEAAMNARVVSVSPGDSRLIIRTADGERVLTVAPSATAVLNQLGPGDEIVVGFDSAVRDSVVSIERTAAPTAAPRPGPRGAVERLAPSPRPAEATAAPSGGAAAAKPAPARRRTARRGPARSTRRARPAGRTSAAGAGAAAAGRAPSPARSPAAEPTAVPPRGAASPMPTPRPVPTPIPVQSPRSATTPEPFPPFPPAATPTPVPTPTPR